MLDSAAYQDNGALFITWDEGELFSGEPIGMILLSPHARGAGYVSNVPYTHSSFLRTLQEIFHVSPLLGDAANAEPMLDLLAGLRLANPRTLSNGVVQIQAT